MRSLRNTLPPPKVLKGITFEQFAVVPIWQKHSNINCKEFFNLANRWTKEIQRFFSVNGFNRYHRIHYHGADKTCSAFQLSTRRSWAENGAFCTAAAEPPIQSQKRYWAGAMYRSRHTHTSTEVQTSCFHHPEINVINPIKYWNKQTSSVRKTFATKTRPPPVPPPRPALRALWAGSSAPPRAVALWLPRSRVPSRPAATASDGEIAEIAECLIRENRSDDGEVGGLCVCNKFVSWSW